MLIRLRLLISHVGTRTPRLVISPPLPVAHGVLITGFPFRSYRQGSRWSCQIVRDHRETLGNRQRQRRRSQTRVMPRTDHVRQRPLQLPFEARCRDSERNGMSDPAPGWKFNLMLSDSVFPSRPRRSKPMRPPPWSERPDLENQVPVSCDWVVVLHERHSRSIV